MTLSAPKAEADPASPIFLALVLLAALLYGGVLNGPFLYDDVVVQSQTELQAQRPSDLLRVFTAPGLNRRLGHLSFAVNHLLAGLDPFSYHVTNVGLHVLAGFLVFLLARRLWSLAPDGAAAAGRPFAVPAVAALLWFVHPVQTQAVSYVYQRLTVQVTVLYLATLVLFLDGIRASGRARTWRLILAGVTAVGALGTKENAGTLPVMAGLVYALFATNRSFRPSRRQLALAVGIAGAFLAICVCYLGPNAVEMITKDSLHRGYTPAQRVMTEWGVVVHYVSLLAWPHPDRLQLDYDWPVATGLLAPPSTLLSLVALLGLLVGSLTQVRRRPLLAFGGLWFLGNLAIESTFIPLDLVYEHRVYLPSIVPFLVLTGLLARVPWPAPAQTALALTVGVLWCGWTIERNRVWSDPIAFFEDNARKAPGKGRVHANLAKAYLERGRIADAEEEFEAAIERDPELRGLRTTLAAIALSRGRPADLDRAEALLREEIRLHPNYAAGHLNLGVLFMHRKDYDTAVAHLRRAHELDPTGGPSNYNLAAALVKAGRAGEAVALLRNALAQGPKDEAGLQALLGAALFEMGRREESRAALAQALRLEPGQALARQYLERLASTADRR